ncbi:MAG: FdtA/QdtA family cupin domain-containing protein, partial [Saprospiraceae bacterium]
MKDLQTVQLLQLPKILDERGNLTFIQSPDHIPFAIKRVFWIYDVPGDETRGAHAYHRQNEVIVALSGSFTVVVHDGTYEQRYHLRRPDVALFLPPLSWRSMVEFSTNSLSLH